MESRSLFPRLRIAPLWRSCLSHARCAVLNPRKQELLHARAERVEDPMDLTFIEIGEDMLVSCEGNRRDRSQAPHTFVGERYKCLSAVGGMWNAFHQIRFHHDVQRAADPRFIDAGAAADFIDGQLLASAEKKKNPQLRISYAVARFIHLARTAANDFRNLNNFDGDKITPVRKLRIIA